MKTPKVRWSRSSPKRQLGMISAAIIAVIVILAALSALVVTKMDDPEPEVSDQGIEVLPPPAQEVPDEPAETSDAQGSFFSSPGTTSSSANPAAGTDLSSESELTGNAVGTSDPGAGLIEDDGTITDAGDTYEENSEYDAAEEREVQEWWSSIQSSMRASESSTATTTSTSTSSVSDTTGSSYSLSDTDTSSLTDNDTTDTSSTESTDTSGTDTGNTDTIDPDDSITLSDPNTYCGKTEFELYAWHQVEPDAAFQFMWDCADI